MLIWARKRIYHLLQASGNPLLYITILLIVIVLFTIYRSLTQISLETADTELEDHSKPRIILKNPRIQVFNDQGIPAYSIRATSLSQYENPDRSLLDKPEIKLLDDPGNVIWKLYGHQILYTSKQLLVEGDVTVLSMLPNQTLNIQTEKLEYDVDSEIATIPGTANVRYGSSVIRAGSTRIDVRQNMLTFDNKVAMTINVSQE